MTTQTWEEYLQLFNQILSGESNNSLYEKPDYQDYVRMNYSRMNRWLKSNDLHPELSKTIEQINAPQTWYLITEPWCGDAAHVAPFVAMLSAKNANIELKIVLRDENLDFMDQYLTNGGRSIPKLIVRDVNGNDILNWGPRPRELSLIFAELKKNNEPFEVIHKTLQNWYNKNKGVDIQAELLEIFQTSLISS